MTGPPVVAEFCWDWSPLWLLMRMLFWAKGLLFWFEMEMTSPRPLLLAMSAICWAEEPAK